MAKKVKPTAITKEELEQLTNLQGSINNVAMNLANIEIAKYEMLQEHSAIKNKMQEVSKELEAKYGSVNISLKDGSISEVEELQAQIDELKK